jgi:molecular chaperone HtpG
VRAKHAERVKNWIEGKPAIHLGVASVMFDEINKMLINMDVEFRNDLGMVCESHHKDDLGDFKKYEVRRYYGTDVNEHVNLHYAAVILRTADLLHITSDRTPSIEYRLINPSDPISQDEWAKQNAVKNVTYKVMRNADGIVIENMQSDTIEVTAKFSGADGANGFFGLISYIIYASGELKKNYDWTQKAQKFENSKYEFPWNKIDDSKIRTEGFEPKRFEFTLDQSRILQLLVGHTLYNDSTVVVRELIQNSIDAIKLQAYLEIGDNSLMRDGAINVNWDTRTRILSFEDNGCGMTQDIIEEHLLKVGSSRYQSESFKKDYPNFNPISRFGIGILTCFLIADNVEIVTSNVDEEEARKLTIRNVNGKYLLQHLDKKELPSHIKRHGTVVNLEVRADVELKDLLDQLNKWVIFPIYPVYLKIDDTEKIRIGFDTPKKAIEHYMKSRNLETDGIKYKVIEEVINGVTIAYALKYNGFYKEWVMLRTSHGRLDAVAAIGTCVEGIRVQFDSPGFNEKGIIAIANATGKYAPRTNVARSDIEAFHGEYHYLKNVYALYVNYLKREVSSLQEQYAFSLSWAAGEIRFLLDPLLTNEQNRAPSLNSVTDADLFIKELSNAKLVLIEQNGKRFLESIQAIEEVNDVWMVDSSLFRSVESLLRESKGSTSLLELVKTLNQGDGLKEEHINTLLCGFDYNGTLHKYVLSKRTVSGIKIFPIDRRVDVCWSKKSANWIMFTGVSDISHYRTNNTKKTYLLQNELVTIDNVEDNSIVECFNLVFILKGSPIWNFLNKAILSLDTVFDNEDESIFEFLLGFMHSLYDVQKDSNTLSIKEVNQNLNATLARYHYNFASDLWSKVARAEFVEALANTVWKIFTPASWNRVGISMIDDDDDLPF